MSRHIEWGHTSTARIDVLPANAALEELAPADGRINGDSVLLLDCGNGDGAAIEGPLETIRALLLRALGQVAMMQRKADPPADG